MIALLVTALAVLAVAGVLLYALTHHPRQETTMPKTPPPGTTSQTIGIEPAPSFVPPTMALDAQFEDIGDRGTCALRGGHEHRWWRLEERDGEQVRLGIVVPVGPSGLVMFTEGSVEEILTAAGFERAEQ